MGAEGWVTAYDLAEIEAKYAEMWPSHNFRADFTYARDDGEWPRSILTLPDGKKVFLDYHDSSYRDATVSHIFYFAHTHEPVVDIPDEIRDHLEWTPDAPYQDGQWQKDKMLASQMRVLTVLLRCWSQQVEVWT